MDNPVSGIEGDQQVPTTPQSPQPGGSGMGGTESRSGNLGGSITQSRPRGGSLEIKIPEKMVMKYLDKGKKFEIVFLTRDLPVPIVLPQSQTQNTSTLTNTRTLGIQTIEETDRMPHNVLRGYEPLDARGSFPESNYFPDGPPEEPDSDSSSENDHKEYKKFIKQTTHCVKCTSDKYYQRHLNDLKGGGASNMIDICTCACKLCRPHTDRLRKCKCACCYTHPGQACRLCKRERCDARCKCVRRELKAREIYRMESSDDDDATLFARNNVKTTILKSTDI